MKKYELTDDIIHFNGRPLHRIIALRDFGKVKKGDKGGWIESEKNLSHKGNCWISNNAKVYDNAKILYNALVCGDTVICDNAQVCGETIRGGVAVICGDAIISSNRDYIVFKNWWSSGRYFTWTRSNNMWSVGCFYGTGEELIKKAYEDSEDKGKHYEEIVKYVNRCVLGNV